MSVRLLFLTPSFFGYESAIADSFRRAGVEVDLVDERPHNSAIARAVLRFAPSVMRRAVKAHYMAVLRMAEDREYDALLIVKGENVPSWFVARFAVLQPRARRLFYTFDSISNSSRGVRLLPQMDQAFTFDRIDAERDKRMTYKPLFFAPEFERGSVSDRTLQVSFVGTLHSDRYAFFRAATRALDTSETSAFFYSPARWLFAVQRVLNRGTRGISVREVSFDKLSRADVAERFASSRAVIDFQRPGQTGLTMRTFEALATGAALITTNEAVRKEPFFDPSRILVVPRDPAHLDSARIAEWVGTLSVSEPPPGFSAYSLDRWVAGIVDESRPE